MSKRKPAPYREGADAYLGLGLGQAIPVHPQREYQPEEGLIGRGSPRGGDAPKKARKRWLQECGSWNLGIHLDARVISLDVDEAEALAAEIDRRDLPPLPATDYSTARGADSPRRQLLYRLPDGVEWSTLGRIPGDPTPGEIIDADHRFVRAWPSIHQKTGRRYRWYSAPTTGGALGTGKKRKTPPSATELATLAPEHVDWLRSDKSRARGGDISAGLDELLEHLDDAETYSDRLAGFVADVPTDGLANDDLNAIFGPLVRAAWRSPGGRRAIEDGVDRYADGYAPKYRRAAWHSVETVARDYAAELASRTVFDMTAPPATAPKKKRKKDKKKTAGKRARDLDHEEYEPTGVVNNTDDPSAPLRVAHDLLGGAVLPPLLYWRDSWYIYVDRHWGAVAEDDVENRLYAVLSDATYTKYGTKGAQDVPWHPTQGKVREVARAIRSIVTVSPVRETPFWIDDRDAPSWLIPATDCLLDPRTGEAHPRSWRFFQPLHVAAALAGDPRRPERWLRFLEEIFPGDPESQALLQEWFGYLISGDSRRHKALIMLGEVRAGKGTILRLAEKLVGGKGVGSTALGLTTLVESFGLETAIGKSLLTVGDLRGTGRDSAIATQRLLEIIGGDAVYINRKNRAAITTTLPGRVMIASNTVPRLYDDSGAIETRFLILRFTQSFLGREQHDLDDALEREIPGIVHWALEGYRRLEERGAFTRPASDAEDRKRLRAASAPVTAFIADACRIEAGPGAACTEVWRAYLAWCSETGASQLERGQFSDALEGLGHGRHRPRVDDEARGTYRYRGLLLGEDLQARISSGATITDIATKLS